MLQKDLEALTDAHHARMRTRRGRAMHRARQMVDPVLARVEYALYQFGLALESRRVRRCGECGAKMARRNKLTDLCEDCSTDPAVVQRNVEQLVKSPQRTGGDRSRESGW